MVNARPLARLFVMNYEQEKRAINTFGGCQVLRHKQPRPGA